MTARRNTFVLHGSLLLDLGFDFVLSLEHLIDFSQIIGPLGNGLRVAFGHIALLQMCLFTKHAHLAHRQPLLSLTRLLNYGSPHHTSLGVPFFLLLTFHAS